MIIAPIIAIVLIYLRYKKEDDIKKMIISFLLLWALITLGLMGMVMLSMKMLFALHLVAILIAYGAIIFYILRNRFIWIGLLSPVATMVLYLILVWIGNEHLPSSL
jgi:hypothetical protein